MIVRLRPQAHASYEALPILGDIVAAFTRWSHREGFAPGTIRNQLKDIRRMVRFFRRRGVGTLGELTTEDFDTAWRRCHKQTATMGGTIRQMRRFLVDQHLLPVEEPPKSLADLQLDLFADHLRSVRGLAEATVLSHTRRLRAFLSFLRFDRTPSVLQQFGIDRIDAFIQQAARTNNRASLQHVVASPRAFLRWKHAEGMIPQPLHLQIDTPRVYRLESLPCAWSWEQVHALLQSIDRSGMCGLRDFTIIYMAAAYGLRSGELVRLRLENIDWRYGTVRIAQTKTRQTLHLPLTDEAGDIL